MSLTDDSCTMIWSYVWYVDKARIHSFLDIEEENHRFVIDFFLEGCLLSEKRPTFAFFCLSGFGSINVDSQESELPMVFNMFVNMFGIAEELG